MRRIRVLSCLILTLAVAAPAPPASAQEERWHLRFGGVWVKPDADLTDADSDGIRVVVDADSAIGFGLALERRFTRRLRLELGALFAEPDIIFSPSLAGGINLRAITLGLNVHITPDKAVDLYLGPFLAHVTYGNLRLGPQDGGGVFSVDVSSSDNFTAGAQIGADVSFGNSPWTLNLVGRFLDSSLDVVTGEERAVRQLPFDSLILGVGFGYRF